MIKKGFEIGFIFLFALIVISEVYAIVGVSPASYTVNFEPNLERTFSFGFIFDEGAESEVYTAGALTEYVTINKESLKGSGEVVATLKLPESIEQPGEHRIFIGAKQIPSGTAGIGIVGNARGVIKVIVPYPGKYAEVIFEASNANAGEPVDFSVMIDNKGKEELDVGVSIEITDSSKEITETLDFENIIIPISGSEKLTRQLDTTNYKPGDYNATAIVRYGKESIEREAVFRLGELYVGISNYSAEFEKNKINKFEIEAESFWNDVINNLFANISIKGYNIEFLTPSIDLAPWTKSKLTGWVVTSEW